MYRYDHYDKVIIQERVAQFRDQVKRRLEGKITENEFKPLRLQNGLYMQLHAYMLRVAIPYGLLSSEQLRKLAGEATLKLNMQRPISEIGELELNKRARWALNLEDDFGSRIYFDLLRGQRGWGVQKMVLPKAEDGAAPQPFTREQPKVGRNEPCPCGSGKKYKQCHGKLQ